MDGSSSGIAFIFSPADFLVETLNGESFVLFDLLFSSSWSIRNSSISFKPSSIATVGAS